MRGRKAWVERPTIHRVSLPEGAEPLGTTQPRKSARRAEMAWPRTRYFPSKKFEIHKCLQAFRGGSACLGEEESREPHWAQKVFPPTACSEHLSPCLPLPLVEGFSYNLDLKCQIEVILKQAMRILFDRTF